MSQSEGDRASGLQIGMFIAEAGPGPCGIDDVIELAQWAERQQLVSGWVPHVPWSLDALTSLALVGRATSTIELGTAVVPTWSRHPYAMAQQALTTQAACDGRLALGLGPSHQNVAEKWYGASYERPVAHVREYLGVLDATFTANEARDSPFGGSVRYAGDQYTVDALIAVTGVSRRPSVHLAALAPLMLRLAGERADGTITWMGDERTHSEHVVPRLARAAAEVGRATPRVIAGLPIAVCDDAATGRDVANRIYATYSQIPTYARMLARGDATSPGDVAVVGTEQQVTARLRSFRDSGATDLCAMVFPVGDDRAGSIRRTREFLASIAPRL